MERMGPLLLREISYTSIGAWINNPIHMTELDVIIHP